MPTQEIPSYEWARFFDECSRQHHGGLVTIEMSGLDIGDQVQARDLPLQGIIVAPNEVGEDQITIIAGDRPDAHVSHTISSPSRVWLKQSEEGTDEALEIECFHNAVRLKFRSTAQPGIVNEVLAKEAIAT